MNEELATLYYENLEKVRNGEISQQVWYAFCANILSQGMLDYQDVFKRLKER